MSCAIPPGQFPEWKQKHAPELAPVATDMCMARVWRAFIAGAAVGAIGMWVVPLILGASQ